MALRDLMNKMMPQGMTLPTQPPQVPQQPPAMLGSGMAQQAAQILQSRPYQLHMQEAQAMGQQPMPPEQFMQMMMQQKAQLPR
jgi:hypothetical protein